MIREQNKGCAHAHLSPPPTYIGFLVNADEERVVHNVQVGQEARVVVDGLVENSLQVPNKKDRA